MGTNTSEINADLKCQNPGIFSTCFQVSSHDQYLLSVEPKLSISGYLPMSWRVAFYCDFFYWFKYIELDGGVGF